MISATIVAAPFLTFRPARVLLPERLGASGAFSLTVAAMAIFAGLPGCAGAEWLPCPCELPEVGTC